MIRRLRRLLGWDSNVASPPSRHVYIPPKANAAAPDTAKRPDATKRRTALRKSGTPLPRSGGARAGSGAAGLHSDKAKAEKDALADLLTEGLELGDDPLGLLDNPALSLDTSEDAGFDPYNTGAFDRSSSWDRISKNRKR